VDASQNASVWNPNLNQKQLQTQEENILSHGDQNQSNQVNQKQLHQRLRNRWPFLNNQ